FSLCIRVPSFVLFFVLLLHRSSRSTLFPYTTLFRSRNAPPAGPRWPGADGRAGCHRPGACRRTRCRRLRRAAPAHAAASPGWARSEEHTSELQSRENLVCRLLLEKKNSNENRDTCVS